MSFAYCATANPKNKGPNTTPKAKIENSNLHILGRKGLVLKDSPFLPFHLQNCEFCSAKLNHIYLKVS